MKWATSFVLLIGISCSSPNSKPIKKDSVVYQADADRAIKIDYNLDKGNLIGKPVHLMVNYAAIACSCAKWVETSASHDTTDEREYFYLEPGDQNIINADTLFDGIHLPIRLELIGQFYEKVGYPKYYNPGKSAPGPARVFKYKRIKIIDDGK